MSDIIKPIITRIDSSANWRTLNPVPKKGEQCIEELGKGLFKLKIGDGVTPWIALKYYTTNTKEFDLDKHQAIFNVTVAYPLFSGYHTIYTAVNSLLQEDLHAGMTIMFQSDEETYELWQYNLSDINSSEYLNVNNWDKIPKLTYIIEELDKKADKAIDLEEQTSVGLVTFNNQGIVTSGTTVIDGGTF